MGWWVAASQRHEQVQATLARSGNRWLLALGVLLLGTVVALAIPSPVELPPEARRPVRSKTYLPKLVPHPLSLWPGSFDEFTPADLAFLKATVSEDPTQLERRMQIGLLLPDGQAYVLLSVTQINHAGEQVGDRKLVRRLRMPLEEFYQSTRAFDRSLVEQVGMGGGPGLRGIQQFVPGFAGFPERDEL